MTVMTMPFVPSTDTKLSRITVSASQISREDGASKTDDPKHPRMTYWLGGGALVEPIMVEIERRAAGGFLVVQPDTGIYGAAQSAAEAVLDLRTALTEHFQALVRLANLGTDLSQQRDFLRLHLRPIE